MEVGLGAGDIVLHGDPAPSKRGHSSPHFSAHVYCGKTAGWIKMPLGTKVGVGPGDSVLDWDRVPLTERGTQPSTFRPKSIVAKRSLISTTAELL